MLRRVFAPAIRPFLLFVPLVFWAELLAAQSPTNFEGYWVSTNPDSLEKAVFELKNSPEAFMHGLISLESSRIKISDKAGNDLESIKNLAERAHSDLGRAMYCHIKGRGLAKTDLEMSAKYLIEANEIFGARKDTVGLMATFYELIGLGYNNNLEGLRDTSATKSYFSKIAGLGGRCGSLYAKLIFYENIIMYNKPVNGVADLAAEIAALEKATRIIDQNPRFEFLRFTFVNVAAGIYFRQERFGDLLKQHLLAYELQKNLPPKYQVSIINNVGTAYYILKDWAPAQKYFKLAAELAKDTPGINDQTLIFTYGSLAELAYREKDYPAAWRNRALCDSFSNVVLKTAQRGYLSGVQAKYEAMKKEAEILKLQQEKKNDAMRTLLVSIVAAFLLVLTGFLAWFYQKTRRLRQLAEFKNEQLALANKRMERFTHALSHDALGYITDILNYATFGKSLAPTDPDLKNIIQRIHRSAGRLKKMAENLIGYNQMRRSNRPENFGLAETVAEVAEDMGLELDAPDIFLRIGEMPAVVADREFVKQVFRNLMGNSVKFRKPDGPLELEISARNATEPGFVEVQIRDNGMGIAAEKMPVIFEEFVKGDRMAKGSGLGLFICRQILEGMGGRIWAESVEGMGSVFSFTLPAGGQ